MKRKTLYSEYFGLTQPPFGISPEPDFFFAGAQREAMLRQLVHFAEDGEGVALITGEVGSGKTMLLTMLMRHCQTVASHLVPILIQRMIVSTEDLVHNLAEQLQIGGDLPLPKLQTQIEARLLALFAEGKRTLVVVDEAHVLPASCIEWLRMLTNLETAQGKMLQIMLFAQPEMLVRLAEPSLRALTDRITLKLFLTGMNPTEVEQYINHRLHLAGYRGDKLFSHRAIRRIARQTGGLSRKVHVLADRALLACYALSDTQVSDHHVRTAIAEINAGTNDATTIYKPQPEKSAEQSGWRWLGSSSGLMLMASMVLAVWMTLTFVVLDHWQQSSPDASSPPVAAPPPKTTSTQSVALEREQNTAKPSGLVLHPGIVLHWVGAGDTTRSMLSQSVAMLQQALAEDGYFIRIISQSANAQEAEKLLVQLQESINENWGGLPKPVNGPPIRLVAYRFQDGNSTFFRVIALGYANEATAKADARAWQKIVQPLVGTRYLLVRPTASLFVSVP